MTEQPHFYRRLGAGRYCSTEHAVGVWSPDEQHMGAATGLLVHELDRAPGGEGKRLARVSLDILGRIPVGECEIVTRVIRPGRRIELVEAEWRADGRAALVARGWRIETADTASGAGVEDPAMPGPEEAAPSGHMAGWQGGFLRSFEFRALPGLRAGAGRAWMRTRARLLDDGSASPLAELLLMVDLANGLVPRTAPQDRVWSHPNLDLQLHLHGAPAGEWLGLDAQQTFGADGVGLTSAVLHDTGGPFGRAEMILMVRPIA